MYFEDAAAGPHCVGVHWFTLYDEYDEAPWAASTARTIISASWTSATEPTTKCAALPSRVTSARTKWPPVARPFADEPEYLPKLYL